MTTWCTTTTSAACTINQAAGSINPGLVAVIGTAITLCIIAVTIHFIFDAVKGRQ